MKIKGIISRVKNNSFRLKLGVNLFVNFFLPSSKNNLKKGDNIEVDYEIIDHKAKVKEIILW